MNGSFEVSTHTEQAARQVPSDSITHLRGSNPILFQAQQKPKMQPEH